MPLIYNVSNFMMRGALRLFGDWKVEGQEYVPPMGPLIVVSNHLSNLDPPMLASSMPRRVHFMAKGGLFRNPIAAAFFRAYGAEPLERQGGDIRIISWALKMLEKDSVIGIFPEGTRNPNGMIEGVSGVALIAIKSGAPILPVGITGSESIGAPWQIVFPRGRFRIRIGQAFSLPAIEGRIGKEQLKSLTTMVMERVAALLPENYRGVYDLKRKTGKDI